MLNRLEDNYAHILAFDLNLIPMFGTRYEPMSQDKFTRVFRLAKPKQSVCVQIKFDAEVLGNELT